MTLFLLENTVVTSSTETRHTSIFERMLAQYTTQYAQSYFSLAIYFFLAFALCGLLAGLAYLLSLSTAQETEKRSEYECGFAPFDSATRLPFDVHFYLVGILFLIFDVEVALLFPWVLSLRTVGWFGFYLMFAFLLILSIGFLYEWKRGALLWPSRRDAVVIRKRDATTQSSFCPPCDKILAHVKLFRSEYIIAFCAVGTLLSILRLCVLSTEELVVAPLVYVIPGSEILFVFYTLYLWYLGAFRVDPTNPDPTKEEIDPALLEELIRAAIEQRKIGAAPAPEYTPPAPSVLGRFLDAITFDCPMLLEGLLFTLICFVITVLSLSLDEEGNDEALSYLSWQAFRTGLVLLSCLAFFDLITPIVGEPVLEAFFEVSALSCLLKVVALFSALFVLDYSAMYLREHSRSLLEYAAIVAFTTFFMLLLVSAAHVMSLFLSLVGFSLGLYVLIMYDASLAPSREAGLKYYYLSALSSGLILYGLILIYITGSNGSFRELFVLFSTNLAPNSLLLACTAVLIALIGFFFKLSSVPGHLWAPDVYEGSPAPVTAFFMLPVKVVVLAAFIQLFALTLVPLSAFWLPTLSVAVAISILWGAFAAVQEKKIRRFFAYASINQMGFLLMGLTTDSDAGFSAAALYILVYAVMTGAFLLIYLTTRLADGRQLLYVSDFRALGATNWPVAFALATILFSMAGIPPLAGFFVKYFVLLEAFLAGQLLLVIIGLALSLVAAYYYLRFIKTSLFESTAGAARIVLHLTWGNLLLLIMLDAFLWGFMLYASELTEFTSIDLLELDLDFLEEEDLILGDEDDFLEGEYDLVDEEIHLNPPNEEQLVYVSDRPIRFSRD